MPMRTGILFVGKSYIEYYRGVIHYINTYNELSCEVSET